MTSATSRSRISGSCIALCMRSRSWTAPTTSAAASGGSAWIDRDLRNAELVHQRHRLTGRLARVNVDKSTQRGALALEQLGDRVPARPQETMVRHPLVVVQLGQVAPPGIGNEHDDDVVPVEVRRELESGPDGRARGASCQDPLVDRHTTSGEEGVCVAHHHHPVDCRGVVGGRPEVLADPFDEIGPARSHPSRRSPRGRLPRSGRRGSGT